MSSILPVSYAWRVLRRAPAFAITAVLTLGVGIGSTVAIFSVIDAIAIRQLPYGHPDRLVGAWYDLPAADARHAPQTLGTYLANRQFARSLDGIAVYQPTSMNLGGDKSGSAPERVHTAAMTANMLPLLEISPRIGRTFSEAEDVPKGPNLVVLSDGLWRRRFGGDPDILGRMIELNAQSYQVIGVMAQTFQFPDAETQIWVPLQLDPRTQYSGGFNYTGIARLKRDVTIQQATAELQSILPRSAELVPTLAPGVQTQMVLDRAKPKAVLDPMREDVVGSFAAILWIVGAAAVLILCVACANVANLLLVRAEARQRELAVRTALGAGRARLFGQFLAEGLLLASLGGVLGLALAEAGVRMFVAWGPPTIPRLAEVRVGAESMVFTIAVVVLVAVVFSVLPLLRRGDYDLGAVLKDGGRSGTSGRGRQRIRAALVTAQVALAVMAMATSGVLARTFERLRAVRLGFDPSNTLTLWVSPSRTAFPRGADIARFYQQIIDRVSVLPGVKNVGVSSHIPLGVDGVDVEPVWRLDAPPEDHDKLAPASLFEQISGGYFAAMGIPLLAGHSFDRIDGRQHAYEVIINRALAQQYWHDSTGRAAIGKQIRSLPTAPWNTIIGVVGTVRDTSLRVAPAGIVYRPETAAPDTAFSLVSRAMAVAIRTTGDPRNVQRSVEAVIHDIDPTLPVFNAATMTDVVARSMTELSFTVIVLGVAAAITLALGAVGLYGVIAFIVGMRTREIGVRLALGARPADVGAMIARHGLMLTAGGLVAGVALFLVLARFLTSLVFEVSPADPIAIGAAVAVLFGVAMLASWIPARRAAQIDPADALRAD